MMVDRDAARVCTPEEEAETLAALAAMDDDGAPIASPVAATDADARG